MKDTKSTQSDLDILTQLNADYLASDHNGDVQRYGQILAEDFMSSLPDFLLRNKKQFLEMMAAPRPFVGDRVSRFGRRGFCVHVRLINCVT